MRASYVLLLVQYRGRYRQGSEIGGALIEIYNVENTYMIQKTRTAAFRSMTASE